VTAHGALLPGVHTAQGCLMNIYGMR